MLQPLPFHTAIREYLKSEERELWNWFASAKAKADYTGNLRHELLKTTYRLDPQSHPEISNSLNEARTQLGLDIPVTLYQAQGSSQMNASLYFIPGEGHIVFSGPALTLLSPEEVKSVIGHELAYHLLWERDGGEFHIVDRLLQAIAADPRAAASHEQTARRCQLYTEIFADRGSLRVTGDILPVVSSLVKMETGLAQVSAASYLKQAEEVFARENASTDGLSHPEAFVRARALALWQANGTDAGAQISRMIEGGDGFQDLDLIGQKRLTHTTRRLLGHLLLPRWFQTPAVLGHAKLFFDDFIPVRTDLSSLRQELGGLGEPAREYIGYVLLDFTQADPDLDEMPLAAALELSRQLELDTVFEKLATKELRLKARDLKRVKESAPEMLAKAESTHD